MIKETASTRPKKRIPQPKVAVGRSNLPRRVPVQEDEDVSDIHTLDGSTGGTEGLDAQIWLAMSLGDDEVSVGSNPEIRKLAEQKFVEARENDYMRIEDSRCAAVGTHSLIYLLTHSLTHLLTNSPTYSLTYSLTHLLTHSPTYSLTYSLTHLLTHSPTHSLICSLTHLLTHSSTHSPNHLLTHSPTHSSTHSPNHLLTHLLTHSPNHSLL